MRDEKASIVEVYEDIFGKMITANGAIALRLMRKLSARLREADRQIQNFLAADGVGRALEVLRAMAGAPGHDGHRPLPPGFDDKALATRAGVPLGDSEAFTA